MTLNEYQALAGRTINKALNNTDILRHSLFEMCGELGEIHSFFQKTYQGHVIDDEELKKEVGDLLWGIAEFCTAKGWLLDEIGFKNIEKLKKRYPNGFSKDASVNRTE